MKYTPPRLHSLSGRDSRGNCANGTGASAVLDTCTIGGGIQEGGGVFCTAGAGDTYCQNGTAADNASVTNCGSGTGPNSTCGTGGIPTT